MFRIKALRVATATVIAFVASFVAMSSVAYAATVSGVTASPSSSTAGAAATYTVGFTTSSSGGLGSGVGTVTLNGPPGTQFPLVATDYTVNGTVVIAAPSHTTSTNVTITTPVTISPSSPVAIVAGVGATVTNTTTAGIDAIGVSTSADLQRHYQ